jgi:hypothetical protein
LVEDDTHLRAFPDVAGGCAGRQHIEHVARHVAIAPADPRSPLHVT